MARPYSDKFLIELQENTSDHLGVRLGRVCVAANLPAAHVAVALQTTRTTVYSWFRGQGIRENKRKIVETFIDLVETDFANGLLPAKSTADAKRYISRMLGVEI